MTQAAEAPETNAMVDSVGAALYGLREVRATLAEGIRELAGAKLDLEQAIARLDATNAEMKAAISEWKAAMAPAESDEMRNILAEMMAPVPALPLWLPVTSLTLSILALVLAVGLWG